MSELVELLYKAVPIVMYRGCLVTKIKTGYRVLSVNCKTVQEVDDVINNSCENLNKSIKK